MSGNRLKRYAVVMAVLAVIMMAFFAMAREVHADVEESTMHVTVSANEEDALTTIKYLFYSNEDPTNQYWLKRGTTSGSMDETWVWKREWDNDVDSL